MKPQFDHKNREISRSGALPLKLLYDCDAFPSGGVTASSAAAVALQFELLGPGPAPGDSAGMGCYR